MAGTNSNHEASDGELRVPMENKRRVIEIDAKIREHMEAINSLKSDRNLLAPWISRLPEEILANIFHILPREPLYVSRGRWIWVTVTQVCKLWHRIALETPRLWSHIDLSFRRKVIENNLQLSGAAALTVLVHNKDLTDSNVAAKYELILQNWSKIHDIEVTGINLDHNEWQSIHSSINGVASCMQSLCLDASYYHASNNIIDCSKMIRTASSLKSLRLSGVIFDWTECSLKNLTDLNLDLFPYNSRRPDVSQILNILALSPTLEELNLTRVGPLDSTSESCVFVKLPVLRKLHLSRLESETCMKMLHFIEMPGSVTWYIDCVNYPIVAPIIIYPTLSIPKSRCKRLSVVLRPQKLIMELKTSLPRVGFPDHDASYEEHLSFEWSDVDAQVWDSLQPFNAMSMVVDNSIWRDVTTLKVAISRDDLEFALEKDHWKKILGPFRDLRYFCCDFGILAPDASSEENLASALRETTSSGSLLCPRLGTLELQFANFSERRGEFFACLCSTLGFRRSRRSGIKKIIINNAVEVHDDVLKKLIRYVDEVEWDEEINLDESDEDEFSEDEDFEDEYIYGGGLHY